MFNTLVQICFILSLPISQKGDPLHNRQCSIMRNNIMNNKNAELPVTNAYDKENKFLFIGIKPSSFEKLHNKPPKKP